MIQSHYDSRSTETQNPARPFKCIISLCFQISFDLFILSIKPNELLFLGSFAGEWDLEIIVAEVCHIIGARQYVIRMLGVHRPHVIVNGANHALGCGLY